MLIRNHFTPRFVIFWLLTAAFYNHALGAQFTDDFFAFVSRFEEEGWAGFWHAYSFNSVYYLSNLVFMATYSLVGYSPWAWFLLFTGLHALNASLAFSFIRKLFLQNNLPSSFMGPLLMALLFLLSPYQTENIIWGGTLNYLLCMGCFWACLLLYAKYIEQGSYSALGFFYLAFVLSLLSLGMSLVFPGIFLVVFAIMWQPFNVMALWRHFRLIVLPLAIMMGLYFALNYFIKGDYITHYGSKAHTTFHISEMWATAWLYLAKLWGNIHFLPHGWNMLIYEKLKLPLYYGSLTAIALGLWALLYKFRPRYGILVLGWVIVVLIALLPVLNMSFNYLLIGENDRLSYAPSIFIYGLPVLLVVMLAQKRVWWLAIWAWTFINASLLLYQVSKWQYASHISNLAAESPLFYGEGDVYLLNVPNYYLGVYIYRSTGYMHWKRAYQLQLPDVSGRLKAVSYANMGSPTDSVTVSVLDAPNTFKVELSAWGNWFWHVDPTEAYSLSFDEWNHSYVLETPNLKPEDRMLYFTPIGWREVNLKAE